jgi:uncharacterized protein
MTKRKTRKKQPRRSTQKKRSGLNLKIINLLLAIIVALIFIIIILLFSYDSKELKESKKELSKTIEQKIDKVTKLANDNQNDLNKYFDRLDIKKDDFEEYTKEFYKDYINKEDEPKQKEQPKVEKEPTQIKQEPKVIDKKPISKPRLAIIIDDVTHQSQVNKIVKLGYKTTISAMPPTPSHPDSAKIVQNLPFYMIHFPLEAQNFHKEEKNTLHTNDSYEKIEKRVAQIRKWYPKAKFTNNHTGSKFTENQEAMEKLFKALNKYNFTFVDSRTTGKSVAKKVALEYNMPYIVRNVFLDNEQDFDYIQNQLKKAVAIAKKNGFAIAICHPHPITLETLKKSKNLLDGIELIYLNQLSIN